MELRDALLMACIDYLKQIGRLTADLESALIDYRKDSRRLSFQVFKTFSMSAVSHLNIQTLGMLL